MTVRDTIGRVVSAAVLAQSAVQAFPVVVYAQCGAAQFPAQTLCGNPGAAQGLLGEYPFATTGQIQSAVAGAVLEAGNVFNSAGALTVLTGTNNVTATLNAGFNFSFLASSNVTYVMQNPTGMKIGETGCIFLTQPAAGTAGTINFSSAWYFAGGTLPTVTNTLNAVDMLCYLVFNATSLVASMVNNLKT
jgi:hypothetical protein